MLQGLRRRPEPPAEVRQRVLTAVEREWRQHKRRRWRLPLAMAAAMLLAVAGAFLLTLPGDGVMLRVAESGGVRLGDHRFRQGDELLLDGNSTLIAETATRLHGASGLELRLRPGTRLNWPAPGTLVLQTGTVYVDTDGAERLQVRTPLGVVSDIGTTFMVTVREGAMEVAMREGVTSIDTEHGIYTARAGDHRGDVVTVDRDKVSSSIEPASAQRWAWIHAVHPDYRQREVVALLRVIAADLGLGLAFASPAVEAAALQSRLEGDLTGLNPQQALDVVLATSGLARAAVSGDDRLLIEFQSARD